MFPELPRTRHHPLRAICGLRDDTAAARALGRGAAGAGAGAARLAFLSAKARSGFASRPRGASKVALLGVTSRPMGGASLRCFCCLGRNIDEPLDAKLVGAHA